MNGDEVINTTINKVNNIALKSIIKNIEIKMRKKKL